jgi:hypothetical protein
MTKVIRMTGAIFQSQKCSLRKMEISSSVTISLLAFGVDPLVCIGWIISLWCIHLDGSWVVTCPSSSSIASFYVRKMT